MKTLRSLALAAILAAGSAAASAAPIYVEAGDAGNATATAADTGATLGALEIQGVVSLEFNAGPDFVDIFKFTTGKTATFRARTGAGFDPALIADPVLYLFDAAGRGVAMDDESGGNGQAAMTQWLSAGTYYMAIAFAGVEPLDTNGGSIFDAFGSLGVLSSDPLDSWLEAPFALDPATNGHYGIQMSVPLPGTLALALAGLLAVAPVRTRLAGRA